MMRFFSALPVVYLSLASLLLQAAEPVIGLVVSQGGLEINRAFVEGNGNLTNGAEVKSNGSPARIRLSNGRQATLGANSQARVFADRVQLEKGQVLATAAGYRADALGFSAIAVDARSQAAVEVRGANVQVAALNGAVKVTDASGMVIARVHPGRALVFERGPGSAAGVSTITGVLRREGDRFVLRDDVSNLNVEVRGEHLASHTGKRVVVTGKTEASADRESQVVLVSRLSQAPQDSQQQGGSRPDQGGNRPDTEKPKTGMSNGAKVAIVAVVAGGAAAGVVAATAGKKDSVSR